MTRVGTAKAGLSHINAQKRSLQYWRGLDSTRRRRAASFQILPNLAADYPFQELDSKHDWVAIPIALQSTRLQSLAIFDFEAAMCSSQHHEHDYEGRADSRQF